MESHAQRLPANEKVIAHAVELYHEQKESVQTVECTAELVTKETARRVIAAFDEVTRIRPLLPGNLREAVYTWMGLFAAFDYAPEEIDGKLQSIIRLKTQKGMH